MSAQLRCSECGGTHDAREFERRIGDRVVKLGASRVCIAKAQGADHQRRKTWNRFWSEGPKQERRKP